MTILNPFLSNDTTFLNNAAHIVQSLKLTDNYDYDIALLKLDRPIDFQDNVIPICLSQDENDENDFQGKTAWATGWGYIGKGYILQSK